MMMMKDKGVEAKFPIKYLERVEKEKVLLSRSVKEGRTNLSI